MDAVSRIFMNNDVTDQLRVLVVEDQVDSAAALVSLTQAWGHNVEVAYNSKDALKRAVQFHPHVVLLDLNLPDGHGYDLAQQVRSFMGDHKVYFIAITGFAQIADQHRSAAAGISHHLIKPVNISLLHDLLTSYHDAQPN